MENGWRMGAWVDVGAWAGGWVGEWVGWWDCLAIGLREHSLLPPPFSLFHRCGRKDAPVHVAIRSYAQIHQDERKQGWHQDKAQDAHVPSHTLVAAAPG